MFKKKPNIKPLAPLRSSDRRKIANQIIKDFAVTIPSTPVQDESAPADHSAEVGIRNSLLPESSLSAKFSTTTGPELITVTGTIYIGSHSEEGGKGEQRPLWVKIAGEELFPSVYTLWKNPKLLPILQTHQPVIEKIKTGADLMVPGLIGPPFPETAKEGRLVAIASSKSPTVPLAVGVCEVDICALENVVGEKGKAVRIVHWVGDEIFNYGGAGGKVPEFLQLEEVAQDTEELTGEMGGVKLEEEGEREDVDGKGKEKEDEAANGDDGGGVDTDGREDIRELTTKEIDEAFELAAIYGLYHHDTTGKSSSLTFPMSSSVFLTTLVLPFLPPASHFPPYNLLQNTGHHPSLTLKKSSHKNAAKFLKYLEKLNLIKTKTRNGGEVVVLDVDFHDRSVNQFVPYRLPEASKEEKKDATSSHTGAAAAGAGGEAPGPMKVVELFRPHGKSIKVFEEIKAETKAFYTPADLKSLINSYIDENSLPLPTNKRLVKLDPLLSNALLTDSREDLATLKTGTIKRDVLAEKFLKSCSPYYAVLKPSETLSSPGVKPKAGAPPKIHIVMENRQGKKTVTKTSGLEPFGVDPKTLAEELQRSCAGSACVGQLVGSSPKNPVMEVMVQGPQKDAVIRALERRGVAAKFVAVVDKTGGKKK